MLKVKRPKYNSTKNFSVFLLVLFAGLKVSAASLDQSSSPMQQQFQGCNNSTYPKLVNKYESDSMDAGTINIQSNGDISLDNNIFIALNDGQIQASSATYTQNQNFIKDIKNGDIYHSNNYFKFLSGSLVKDSGELELDHGKAYLRDRNLLIDYQSLTGNLGQNLIFKNASLSSCNDVSVGWEIKAQSININEETDRGYIEDLSLKVLDRRILKLPYLPFRKGK